MAIITDAMVPVANTQYIVTPSSKKLMIMFDGPMPTKEQFEAKMYSTELMYGAIRGQYNILALVNSAIAGGATPRAHCLFPASLPVHHMGPTKIRFPLSEQPIDFTKLSAGNVSWFMFLCVSPSTAIYNQSIQAYWAAYGSIGDVGSGADLQLIGSAINDTDSLKANDLIFNYSGF